MGHLVPIRPKGMKSGKSELTCSFEYEQNMLDMEAKRPDAFCIVGLSRADCFAAFVQIEIMRTIKQEHAN